MKHLGSAKLRTKTILTTVVVCVAALLLQGGVLLFLSTQTFSSKAYEDMAYFLESNHSLLNNKMTYIENIILNLRNDPAMQSFFTGNYDQLQISRQYAFCTSLSSEQNLVNATVPFVPEVFVFNTTGSCLQEYYDVSVISTQEQAKAEETAKLLYHSYREASTTVNCSVRGDALYLIVKLYSRQLTEQGMCIVKVDLSALELVLKEIGKYDFSFWSLLGAGGEEVKTYGMSLSPEEAKILWQDQQYYMHTVELKGVTYEIVPFNLSFGLKSVTAVPASQIYANRRIMTMSTLVTLLVLIPVMLGVAFFSSWTVTEPLKTVADKLKQFGKGDWNTKLDSFGVVELDDIVEVFNEMTERIHTLITQVYENQLLASKAQIKYLQSQINPHFLYNVLSTISLQAKMDGNEEVYRMVYSLSNLLQGKLFRSGEIEIKLREELELVEFYLYLQNKRFPDRLSYEIDCGEGVKELPVPRMCIEPVVENAVTHGLEPKEGKGFVRIRIYQEGSSLLVQVSDDGVGFSPEGLQDNKHTHVGLKNIEQLIHNLYGEGYGMQIESEPGQGTRVLLSLPAGGRSCLEEGHVGG